MCVLVYWTILTESAFSTLAFRFPSLARSLFDLLLLCVFISLIVIATTTTNTSTQKSNLMRLFKRILSAHSFVCVRIYSVLQQHHRKKRQTYARSSIRKLFLTQGFYWYVWLYSMVDTHRWRSMFMRVWARRKYEQPHSRTPCNADGQTDRHQVFVLFPLSYARHTCVHLLSSSHIHQLCECERVHCAYVVVQEFVCPWINGKNNLYFVSVVVLFFSSFFFWCVMCGFGIRLCRSIYLYSFLVWCLKWMRFYFSSSCERARVHCVKR